MKKYIIVLFFCPIVGAVAQAPKLKLMQGIWDYTMNTDTSKYYKVVYGKKCLAFSYTSNNTDLEFTLFEMVIGFQNIATKYDETDFIHVDSLKEDGRYYTEIINKNYITSEGIIDKTYCIIASYFECDGEVLSINGGKLFEYEKIDELPFEALSKLYKRGKLDKRDYIKDYLKLKTRQVKPLKCKVYRSPSEQSKVQLKRDDVVIITEEANKWVKVKYSEEGLGWIKKDDLK